MTCKCGKPVKKQTVATKTKQVGDWTLLEQKREALVCAECGVIAWDPPVQQIAHPFTYPSLPFTPIPATPYWPYISPNTSLPWRPPQGGATC